MRAEYGQELLRRLAADLTQRHGRGFGAANLSQMKRFYQLWPAAEIAMSPKEIAARQEPSGTSPLTGLDSCFPLPWSAYVRLLTVKSQPARQFYEAEALRGGWSVRQRRLRIGDEWFRVDLLFFHRQLRCLVLIDLKLGRFGHADAGQMHMYLNYAREHWMQQGENPPVGLILCAQKDDSLAHYALDNLPSKVLAAEYRTVLPDEKVIASELERTRRMIEGRQPEQVGNG